MAISRFLRGNQAKKFIDLNDSFLSKLRLFENRVGEDRLAKILEAIPEFMEDREHMLGEGDTAQVFPDKSGQFCIKEIVINPKDILPTHLNSVIREAKIQDKAHALGVKTPDVIFAAATKNGKQFLAMEIIKSKTVEEAISNPEFFPKNFNKEKFIIKLFDMVAILNKNKIYHRDLKPKNLLFDEDGGPVIIDFGVSVQGGFLSRGNPFEEFDSETNETVSFMTDTDRVKELANLL